MGCDAATTQFIVDFNLQAYEAWKTRQVQGMLSEDQRAEDMGEKIASAIFAASVRHADRVASRKPMTLIGVHGNFEEKRWSMALRVRDEEA